MPDALQRALDVVEAAAELFVGAASAASESILRCRPRLTRANSTSPNSSFMAAVSPVGNRLAQFADLLLDLVEDRRGLGPVEADAGRLFLKLQRAGQRGQGHRNAVQKTLAMVLRVEAAGEARLALVALSPRP